MSLFLKKLCVLNRNLPVITLYNPHISNSLSQILGTSACQQSFLDNHNDRFHRTFLDRQLSAMTFLHSSLVQERRLTNISGLDEPHLTHPS